MRSTFKAGDRVTVPFGWHEVIGTVLRVSETGLGVRVTVELAIEGTDEPFVTTYPGDQVALTTAA